MTNNTMTDRRNFIKALTTGALALPALSISAPANEEIENLELENPILDFSDTVAIEYSRKLEVDISYLNLQVKCQSILNKILKNGGTMLIPPNPNDLEMKNSTKYLGCHAQVRLSDLFPCKDFRTYHIKIKNRTAAEITKQEHAYLFNTLEKYTSNQRLTDNWQNQLIHLCLHSVDQPHYLIINKPMLDQISKGKPFYPKKLHSYTEENLNLFDGHIGQYYTSIDEIDEIDGLTVYADVFTQNQTEPRAYLMPHQDKSGILFDTDCQQIIHPNNRELRAGLVIYKSLEIELDRNNDIWRLV